MKWFTQKYPLNQKMMENNARNIYAYFSEKGWTVNAVAGMLGNMEIETTMNPAIFQNWVENPCGFLTDWTKIPATMSEFWEIFLARANKGGGGFGLVQWTSCRKFFEWYFVEVAQKLNQEVDPHNCYYWARYLDYYYKGGEYPRPQPEPMTRNIEGVIEDVFLYECERIEFEKNNNLQWDETIYNQTFAEFASSTESPYILGVKFLHAYEKPAEFHDEQRGRLAQKWYNFLTGRTLIPILAKKLPFWYNGIERSW